MKRNLLATTAIAATLGLWGSAALASTTLYVGLQYDGGAITTVGFGPSPLTLSGVSFGTFNISGIFGMGTPSLPLPDLSVSNVFITNSPTGPAGPVYSAGTLNIFLTETGITSPTGPLSILSTLDYNMNAGTLVMTGVDSYSDTDALYGGTQIASFGPDTAVAGTPSENSGAGDSSTNPADPTGTYSVTEEITITAPSDTIDWANNSGMSLDVVPEPASLSLLGGGLIAFGAWRRKRRNA